LPLISILHSHFPFAGLLKFVFVYFANTAVLCYSLTIICCCQVQNYIYWLISTENDHRHHHKFIKYEKRLRKEGNMLDLPINNNQAKSLPLQREIWRVALLWVRSIQRQRSNWSPTFVPFGRYFTSIHLSLWIRQSPFSSTRWQFLFCPRTTCCLLFLNSAHAQDVFT
jgi:hypothetical protein